MKVNSWEEKWRKINGPDCTTWHLPNGRLRSSHVKESISFNSAQDVEYIMWFYGEETKCKRCKERLETSRFFLSKKEGILPWKWNGLKWGTRKRHTISKPSRVKWNGMRQGNMFGAVHLPKWVKLPLWPKKKTWREHVRHGSGHAKLYSGQVEVYIEPEEKSQVVGLPHVMQLGDFWHKNHLYGKVTWRASFGMRFGTLNLVGNVTLLLEDGMKISGLSSLSTIACKEAHFGDTCVGTRKGFTYNPWL